MITRFRIQNYKALRDVLLDLTRVHLLIGPNDSGKSSILEAIEAMSRVITLPRRWSSICRAFLTEMAKPVANLWISIVLGALIVLGTPGCATITIDLPDDHDVDEVPLALVPKFVGGALRVLPATGGEVLTYRFRYYRRGMDPAEWNPFLVAHLKRELARRGVDIDRGRTVTVRLIEFEAGTKALGGGKRAIFVVEVSDDEFRKRYTGSESGYWSTLNGTMGRAVSEVLAEMLGDEAFQALMQ